MDKILVELDALLDTRLGTANYLDHSLPKKLCDAGYLKRQTDNFAHELGVDLDQAKFDQTYRQRGEQVLRHSYMTNLMPAFSHITEDLARQAIHTPFQQDIRVEVNLHPFSMTEAVAKEVCASVGYMLSIETEVEHTFLSHQELTPQFIDKHYAALFIYDFNNWINHHSEALKENPLTRVTFVCPALYSGQIPNEEDVYDEEIGNIDPFASTEMILVEYLDLHLVEPYYFSLLDPNRK